MGKSDKEDTKDAIEARLKALQIALVDAQLAFLADGRKMVIVFEGRDASGKDGAIKRITECLSVRYTRVVALPKPTEREKGQWWFQRYVAHLPTATEWVLFNRSWYNRAGVERVMGFSTREQQEIFIDEVAGFEKMLVENGIILIKFWLDISREEQAKRLMERRSDPRKRLKISDIDKAAQEKWDDFTTARDDMFKRSHHKHAPWTCVVTDNKDAARENIILHILNVINLPNYSVDVPKVDARIVFDFDDVLSGKRALNG
jgi:polyphosphate kinase 2